MPDDFYNSREWRSARWERIKKDSFRCVRCRKLGRWSRGLTVHHIIPRQRGGSEYMANLVTLCQKCHDLIEGENLRSIAAIMGFRQDDIVMHDAEGWTLDEEEAITWQSVVYGGMATTDPTKLIAQEPQGIPADEIMILPIAERIKRELKRRRKRLHRQRRTWPA